MQRSGQIFDWGAAVCGAPSRSSSTAGGGGHLPSGFMLITRCGWVVDHSRLLTDGLDRPNARSHA